MRLLPVALLGLVALIAMPAMGQDEPPNTSGSVGHAFGSANCPQRIACPDDNPGETPSVDQLAAIANACIPRYLGYASDSGFIDTSQELSLNNCLTSLPNVIPKGVGQQLSPLCCIVKMPDNTCLLHCDLVTQ